MPTENTTPASIYYKTSRALQQNLFRLLQNCNSLKTLAQIHAQIITNAFSQKGFLASKLLSRYVSSDHLLLLSAHHIFEGVENPSTPLWNQMIRGLARSDTPRDAVGLFNRMAQTAAEADGFTYSFLLSGCARAGLLREGEQVHCKVLRNGHFSNVYVKTNLVNLYSMGGRVGYARRVFDDMSYRSVVSWNSMISGYVKSGDVDQARRIFDEMPERSVVSWTSMISGYARNGKCKQALRLFHEMRRARVGLDDVALLAALSACAELGDLKLGRWIHSYVEEKLSGEGRPLLLSLNNALIHMYASCGVIEEAYEVFRWMPRRNTVSWTSMIVAFAKQGYAQEALAVFQLMLSVGAKEARPDDITFIGVLCACSHSGFVEEGRRIFTSMIQNWGIKPRIEHYGCMVDLLSRAGLLDEACDLIETMPIKPNDVVWGALLGGCRIHKNAELASSAAEKLVVELDPDQAAGYLLLLGHVYAIAERGQDLAVVKKKMVEMGVRKPAGRSWVQIDGAVHDFVAGDVSHKHSSAVYEMLDKITRQAKLEADKSSMNDIVDVGG